MKNWTYNNYLILLLIFTDVYFYIFVFENFYNGK